MSEQWPEKVFVLEPGYNDSTFLEEHELCVENNLPITVVVRADQDTQTVYVKLEEKR